VCKSYVSLDYIREKAKGREEEEKKKEKRIIKEKEKKRRHQRTAM